jgi:hypothetical protein
MLINQLLERKQNNVLYQTLPINLFLDSAFSVVKKDQCSGVTTNLGMGCGSIFYLKSHIILNFFLDKV